MLDDWHFDGLDFTVRSTTQPEELKKNIQFQLNKKSINTSTDDQVNGHATTWCPDWRTFQVSATTAVNGATDEWLSQCQSSGRYHSQMGKLKIKCREWQLFTVLKRSKKIIILHKVLQLTIYNFQHFKNNFLKLKLKLNLTKRVKHYLT